MNVALSILLGLVFVVLHTACLPELFISGWYLDLLLPLVIYISIFRSVIQSVFLILVFGLAMDSLSGSPFGLYTITYAWLLLGVRGSMRFLDAGSYFLFPLILASGVMLEDLLFAFSVAAVPSMEVLIQALWALVTAPFFLLLFHVLFHRFKQITARPGHDPQGP